MYVYICIRIFIYINVEDGFGQRHLDVAVGLLLLEMYLWHVPTSLLWYSVPLHNQHVCCLWVCVRLCVCTAQRQVQNLYVLY